jgi:outer membrane protein OmpA-like peptidoglycan-associated protein/uncharacterized protein YidB (DUF937 family)
MALFDSLLNEVSRKYGLGDKAGSLLSGLLGLVTNNQTGGLAGFVQRFQRGGLGDIVSSWVSRGENAPISTGQVENTLGKGTVNQLAREAGIEAGAASSVLSFLLPKVVDALTPDGVLPASLPDSIKSYLGGVGDSISSAATSVTSTAKRVIDDVDDQPSSGGGTWWLILLLLGVLGFLGWQYLSPGEKVAETVSPVAGSGEAASDVAQQAGEAVTDTVDSAKDALGSLAEKAGEAAEATQEAATDAARMAGEAVTGAGETAQGAVDTLAEKAGEAAEATQEAAADATQKAGEMVAGVGETAGSEEKASEALSTLKAGFTGQDLVSALNLMIVHFDTGSATIAAADHAILDKAADAIKKAPGETVIEVGGHTDSQGNPGSNLTLSTTRSDAVRSALVERGVNAAMLKAKGYGGSNPVADNATEEGRAKNRRIEFKVLD